MIAPLTNTSVASTGLPVARPSQPEDARRVEAQARTEVPARDEGASVIVTISPEAVSQAKPPAALVPSAGAPAAVEEAPAPDLATAAPAATATSSTQSPYKPELAYETADTNKDGKVTEFEQQAYEFKYPQRVPPRETAELTRAASTASTASAASAASAELRAYEEVARAGRNL